MATATLRQVRPRSKRLRLGPDQNGIVLTADEFDAASFEEDWRYELIHGVLVVSPIPSEAERDPNGVLGAYLTLYQKTHPQGSSLDVTLFEHEIPIGDNRRKVDRVLWAGLGRLPVPEELPTVAIEFVSKRRRDQIRDYETKRDEYLEAGIQQYWVVDRFKETLTVFALARGRLKTKVFHANQAFRTDLLPGFELNLQELFHHANRWDKRAEKA